MTYFRLVTLVAMALLYSEINALPTGAPDTACASMTPNHRNFNPQTSPSPYGVRPRRVGSLFEVTIVDTTGTTPFMGFLIQARRGNEIVGKFVTIPSEGQYLTCIYAQSAVTHVDANFKSQVTVTWDPQGASVAGITFVASKRKTALAQLPTSCCNGYTLGVDCSQNEFEGGNPIPWVGPIGLQPNGPIFDY